MTPNAIKSVAEVHISRTVLIIISFVAVHMHLCNVYLPVFASAKEETLKVAHATSCNLLQGVNESCTKYFLQWV